MGDVARVAVPSRAGCLSEAAGQDEYLALHGGVFYTAVSLTRRCPLHGGVLYTVRVLYTYSTPHSTPHFTRDTALYTLLHRSSASGRRAAPARVDR